MTNAWEQVGWIAAEALNHLEDALVITQLASKDKTADFNVKPNGYAIGSSVDIRTNPVYATEEFTSSIVVQDIRSAKRTMSIEKHFDISVQMTAQEKRMDFDNFSEQVIKPAAYAIAESCDSYVGEQILKGAGLYVSAETFADAADMALAKKSATFQQLAATGRFALINDILEARLLGKTYFNTYNNRGESGERVFNDGALGKAMGMEFFSSLNVPTDSHTPGSGVGVTNNTGTTNLVGLSVLTTDASTGQFEVGDRIEIAGVRRPLIVSTQTVATSTAIPLTDPIMEIIPDGAAITTISSAAAYTVNGAIFDDSSLAFASPMLDPASDKPTSVATSNGYAIRVVQGYDMTTKKETISLDMLAAATAYDPRRITMLGDVN